MAKKGSLNIVELHVEKLVLALAVLFMLGLGGYYLFMAPNSVEYRGEPVGPEEVDQVIYDQAQRLQQAMAGARPPAYEVPDYSAQLERKLDEGIFAADAGPPLPEELRVATSFGTPLPKFEEDGVGSQNVAVVTPLPPSPPVVRTGISLVAKRPLTLQVAEGAAPPDLPPATRSDLQELAWVTVAGYFPLEAQRKDMMNEGGYAGYLSKPYLIGTEVQRQELTPSGEWSDWQLVDPGAVMPELPVPTPVFDDNSGQLLNDNEIQAALAQVKYWQPTLMQPPFYPVYAGDIWLPPPLPGQEELLAQLQPQEEEEEQPEVPTGPPDGGRGGFSPPPGGFGGPPGGGRFGGPPGGGRGRGGGGRGGAGAGGPPPGPTVDPEREAQKEIRQAIQDALDALQKKDLQEAEDRARFVLNHQYAKRGVKNRATRVVEAVEKLRGREQPLVPINPTPPFVKQPETDEPAVWVHDDTVEPGMTYRYRVRVKLWNRYVGRVEAVKNPEDARQPVLVGEWSLPSDPINVAQKQHFFVTGRAFGEPAARVEVFQWRKGNWLRERFEVKVGDTIGGLVETRTGEIDVENPLRPKREPIDFGTGAVVLDVRVDEPVLQRRVTNSDGDFTYSDREALVLVYLDPADGQVKQRVDAIDRDSPQYNRLKNEYEQYIE